MSSGDLLVLVNLHITSYNFYGYILLYQMESFHAICWGFFNSYTFCCGEFFFAFQNIFCICFFLSTSDSLLLYYCLFSINTKIFNINHLLFIWWHCVLFFIFLVFDFFTEFIFLFFCLRFFYSRVSLTFQSLQTTSDSMQFPFIFSFICVIFMLSAIYYSFEF